MRDIVLENEFILVVFLALQVTGTDVILVISEVRNNRKLICIDFNDVNSGNLNNQRP